MSGRVCLLTIPQPIWTNMIYVLFVFLKYGQRRSCRIPALTSCKSPEDETHCIYSSIVLKHNFEVLDLYLSISTTPAQGFLRLTMPLFVCLLVFLYVWEHLEPKICPVNTFNLWLTSFHSSFFSPNLSFSGCFVEPKLTFGDSELLLSHLSC